LNERTRGTNVSKILLIVGGPGAGKTTVSRRVAEHFELSVHHKADDIREAVVSGFPVPEYPYTEENLRQFRLARSVSTFLAGSYCDAGFDVVVDETFAGFVTDGFSELLADERTIPIYLRPTKEALIARMRARQGPFDELLSGIIEDLFDVISAEMPEERWNVIDNTDMSIDETVAAVLRLTSA
jgi:broad-specificity NMP kinase